MRALYIEKFSKIGYLSIFLYKNVFVKITFGTQEPKKFDISNKYNSLVKSFFDTVDKYLNGEKVEFSFPYYLESTKFYTKVYNELKKIKYGRTISYKELAIKSGNKMAFRAVGSACKKNPLPLIIPCHRVIKSNGDLGDFAGGKEIKIELLKLEKGVSYES